MWSIDSSEFEGLYQCKSNILGIEHCSTQQYNAADDEQEQSQIWWINYDLKYTR